jgi:hypothetical protein
VGSNIPPTVQSVTTINPFSIQLRLGNDFLPVQPITDVPTLINELEKSMHFVSDMTKSIPVHLTTRSFRSTNNNTVTNMITGGGSTTEYNFLQNNGYLTPYIPIDALDDQTITLNPCYLDYQRTTSTIQVAGAPQNVPTSILLNTLLGTRGNYCLNEFLPPKSNFVLGFDLETFQNQSTTIRSGRYLGNGTITLQMSNAFACNTKSVSTNASIDIYNVLAIVLHDIRFNIGRGGQIIAYY